VNLPSSKNLSTSACVLTHVFSVSMPGASSSSSGGSSSSSSKGGASGGGRHHHHPTTQARKLVACLAGGNAVALFNIDVSAKPSGTAMGAEKALASVQLGAHPIIAASVVEGGGSSGLTFVVAVASDWMVWLVSVDTGYGASSSSSTATFAPKLRVLGLKQGCAPGGAPPWDTAPADAASASANAGAGASGSSNNEAAHVAYDKAVKAEGGTFQVDDAEAEAGGPGRRAIMTAWGELLMTAHGASECLRLPLLHWPALVGGGVVGGAGGGQGEGGNSELDNHVNTGPTLTAQLSDFPVLTPAALTKGEEEEVEEVARAAAAAQMAESSKDSASLGGEGDAGGQEGEGLDVDEHEGGEDNEEAAATAAAAAAAVAAMGLADDNEPSDDASSSSSSSSSVPGKKMRRASMSSKIMSRFTKATPAGSKGADGGGVGGAEKESPPPGKSNSSSGGGGVGGGTSSRNFLAPQALDLEPIFDVYFALPPRELRTSGGDGVGEDRGGEGDLSNLSEAEKTKRLMQKRSEDLKRVDEKMKKMQEGAVEYRANAARIKEESKKKANAWPF
jgi:hypothetical protein